MSGLKCKKRGGLISVEKREEDGERLS